MSHENFRHGHDDHQPGSAVALHLEEGEVLPLPGIPGRLAHLHGSGHLWCDEGVEWAEMVDDPHDHHDDYAPGRVLTASEVTTLDDYLANAEPTLVQTADALKALASVVRRT